MRKVVHIFPNEKFSFQYIKKINEIFGENAHFFLIHGEPVDDKIEIAREKNVAFLNNNIWEIYPILKKQISKSSKVVLHSLNLSNSLFASLLFLQKKEGRKYFWNIWGGDLYNSYWNRNRNIKSKIREAVRKYFIKRLPAVGYIPSDYKFLKEHYTTKADFYLASYAYNFFEINEEECNNEKFVVLLGNSATETCQYEEIIDKLTLCKRDNLKVYCVLSYPQNKNYIERISKYGKEKLGDIFFPQIEFMKYDEYMSFLASVDVAIFNHNRQQGLGNIASLLYLGKKVIINPANGCKDYFEKMGATLYSTENVGDILYEPIEDEIKINNKECIRSFFSDEEFGKRWRKVFDADY